MPHIFREQPRLRLFIGAVIVVVVWALYIVRTAFGMGPMHDPQGNQAPTLHYLVGALIGTGMVVIWIVARAIMTRPQTRNMKPPEERE